MTEQVTWQRGQHKIGHIGQQLHLPPPLQPRPGTCGTGARLSFTPNPCRSEPFPDNSSRTRHQPIRPLRTPSRAAGGGGGGPAVPADSGTPARARGGSNPPQALPASPRSAVPAPLRSPARYSSSFCPQRTSRAGPAAAAMAGGGTRDCGAAQAAAEHPPPAQGYPVSEGREKEPWGAGKEAGRAQGEGKGMWGVGKGARKGTVRGGKRGGKGRVKGRERRWAAVTGGERSGERSGKEHRDHSWRKWEQWKCGVLDASEHSSQGTHEIAAPQASAALHSFVQMLQPFRSLGII